MLESHDYDEHTSLETQALNGEDNTFRCFRVGIWAKHAQNPVSFTKNSINRRKQDRTPEQSCCANFCIFFVSACIISGLVIAIVVFTIKVRCNSFDTSFDQSIQFMSDNITALNIINRSPDGGFSVQFDKALQTNQGSKVVVFIKNLAVSEKMRKEMSDWQWKGKTLHISSIPHSPKHVLGLDSTCQNSFQALNLPEGPKTTYFQKVNVTVRHKSFLDFDVPYFDDEHDNSALSIQTLLLQAEKGPISASNFDVHNISITHKKFGEIVKLSSIWIHDHLIVQAPESDILLEDIISASITSLEYIEKIIYGGRPSRWAITTNDGDIKMINAPITSSVNFNVTNLNQLLNNTNIEKDRIINAAQVVILTDSGDLDIIISNPLISFFFHFISINGDFEYSTKSSRIMLDDECKFPPEEFLVEARQKWKFPENKDIDVCVSGFVNSTIPVDHPINFTPLVVFVSDHGDVDLKVD